MIVSAESKVKVGAALSLAHCGELLHCVKFDTDRVRANPNAKKYRLGVSFLVVSNATGD
ncbi:hypothetical protein [Paraburkholderia sp.]|uniref:hypothetical protein n=1 Tax=Paraburkholderia sp. TaxID=1926495 RepID=UPI003D6F767A